MSTPAAGSWPGDCAKDCKFDATDEKFDTKPYLPSVTPDELARHNTAKSCWIAVRGKVYDITDFKQRHPGGRTILAHAAGRDATVLFETYHDPMRVLPVLSKLSLIAVLDSPELPVFAPRSEFHGKVLERVRAHFAKHSRDPKRPPLNAWLTYAVIYGTILLSWLAQFYCVRSALLLQLPLAALLGAACALLGLHPMHDASHFSITHSPCVWFLLAHTHDFLNGASSVVWNYQHVLGHHPYTNIAGADPDIAVHNDRDIRRILPSQPWYAFYKLQRRFVPLLYGFLALKTRFQDFQIMFVAKSNDKIRVNPMSPLLLGMFLCGKLFFVVYRVLVPWLLLGHSLTRVLGLLAVADAVTSYWLALTFQANHVVTEAKLPYKPKNESHDTSMTDWAEMQLATTLDYNTRSPLCRLLTGALNLQAVHHLFPYVHQHYYPELVQILSETAKEFGVNYSSMPSFTHAFNSHLEHLEILGRKPKAN